MSYGLRRAQHSLPEEAKLHASSVETAEPSLSALLDRLHDTPPRNAEAAARGRAAFLAEAAAMRSEFVRKPKRGVLGWLSDLVKRWLGVDRSDDAASTSHTLRRVSASLMPGLMATLAGITIVTVAQGSLPTQPLYTVKLWSEDVQLSFTVEPESRLALLIKFINCRVSELNALHQQGESPSPQFMDRLEKQVSEALQLLNAKSNPNPSDVITVNGLEQLRATAIAPSSLVLPDRSVQPTVLPSSTPTVVHTGMPVERTWLPGVVATMSGSPKAIVTKTSPMDSATATSGPTSTPVPSAPVVTFATTDENSTATANESTDGTAPTIGGSVDIKASLPTATAVTVPVLPTVVVPQPVVIPLTPQPTIAQPTPTPVHVVPTPQPTIAQPTPTPVHVVPTPQPTPTPVHVVPTPQPTIAQPTPTPVQVVPTPLAPVPILPPALPIDIPALPIGTPAAPALPIVPTVVNPIPAPIFSLENPEATATPLPDESMHTNAPPTPGPMPDQARQQDEATGDR